MNCKFCGGELLNKINGNPMGHREHECIRVLNKRISMQGELLDSLINALAEGGIVKITIKEKND